MAHRTPPRPGKFRFAYAESPAKQRHDRDIRGISHNPNEPGRICILHAGVPPLSALVVFLPGTWHGAGGFLCLVLCLIHHKTLPDSPFTMRLLARRFRSRPPSDSPRHETFFS